MLTNEELAAIPLFSTLADAALTELGEGAADIHLNTAEYAVHEGSFEVIKLIDGIERKIGMRQTGKIFGEVPLVYGTQFQSSCRACEPSRVLKVDARFYYAAAAASPELARTVGDLARERIGGLQGIV